MRNSEDLSVFGMLTEHVLKKKAQMRKIISKNNSYLFWAAIIIADRTAAVHNGQPLRKES